MDETPMPVEKKESGIGAMIGIVIVVLLLAVGGVYFFITQEMKFHETPADEQVTP